MKNKTVITRACGFFVASVFLAGSVYAVGERVSPLPDSLWASSEWISAVDVPVVTGRIGDNENNRAADGASWFILPLKAEKEIKYVKWMTTGLGVYDIYVNGILIGDEVLKPGFTHPEKTRLSYTYDVTDAVNKSSGSHNEFAVQVTPGWWGDKIITPAGHEGMIGRKPAFRGVIEVVYADDTSEIFGTDTHNWLAGVGGPVTHSAIFDGMSYDARISMPFGMYAGMSMPEINNEFNGEILPSMGAEVFHRYDLALSPVSAYVWKDVTDNNDDVFGKVKIERSFESGDEIKLNPGETLVVDFGQNAAAVPLFRFRSQKDATMTCLPGELLNSHGGSRMKGMDGPEGSVHRLNLRIPDSGMRLDYTFGTDGETEEFIPRSTFYGYRYISVTADCPVVIESVQSVPVSSISQAMESGKIRTGNESVNRLISNTLWGQRSNYLSVPTDCPQRNERLGWTADTQVFSETGTFFADTRAFFHKWLRDLRDTQDDFGGFPGVAPFAQYGANPGDYFRLGWSDAGVIVPWVVWKQFGDTDIIDESWASMEKYLDSMSRTRYDHNALLGENANFQWADWLSYEPLESCGGGIYTTDSNGHTSLRPEAVDYWNYLSACYWIIDASMMADMARATGRDAVKYENMANEARQYVKEKFLTPEGMFRTEILNTMQTPALFALKTDVVDGEAREKMKQRLRKNFAEHGNCLQTGFLGTSILMPTLTENGMTDIAYELLLQRSNPSWLYSVDNGATTIWERWNSYTIDSGMGPQGMNSFNHYAYGCVCEWLWETAAGIACEPSAPGFSKVIMKPVPDPRLGFVEATYRTPKGNVESKWKYTDKNWEWTFAIPQGTTAEVTLPGRSVAHTFAPGTYKVKLPVGSVESR